MNKLIPGRAHKIGVVKKEKILNRHGMINNSMTDGLTGLFNKKYADVEVRKYLEKGLVADPVIFIVDIDNFALLNEAFGYSYGDEIIKSVAKNLKMIFKSEDIIARIDSDKFLILMGNCNNKRDEVVTRKAELICKYVRGLYMGEGNRLSASIGIVYVDKRDKNYDGIINKAGMALSYVKNHNKDGFKIYDSKLKAEKGPIRIARVTINGKKAIERPSEDEFAAISQEMVDRLREKITTTDMLTGIYTYDTFIGKLKAEIHRGQKKLAIIYADIKNFRYINDNFGYSIGDKLLKMFCEITNTKMVGYLYASRVYSDNIVIAYQMDGNKTDKENLKDIDCALEEISSTMQSRFLNKKVSVCAGVYVLDKSVRDPEVAVSNANLARKEAKKQENSIMVVFKDELKYDYNYKMRLAADLPASLRNKELRVYFQPKVESGTGKVVGGEALVRWQKADGAIIYPNDFIPYFEESGLIVDVDYYVYDAVFASIRARLDQNQPIVPISMNISRVHLKDDEFINYIKSLFSKYNIPSQYIEFELTESVYIQNYDGALKLLEALREMGVKISMDDFGSGYSSLNMLNNFPIDVLKIDKVFLGKDNKPLENGQKIIIKSVIDMATKLNMRTVCEGVESQEQSEFLTSVGCDMIQGFFYERPMPEEGFYSYLEEHEKIGYGYVRFPLDNSLVSEDGKYESAYIGDTLRYCNGPFEGTKAVALPGGVVGNGLLDIPANIYNNASYTISCWAKISKVNMWSSLLFSDFENGFSSIIPHAGDLCCNFRVLEKTGNIQWNDTGSQVAIDDKWHFYAGSFNAVTSTATLYIDDVVAGYSTNVPILNSPRRVFVGGDIFQNPLAGAVAEVRLFNQALSKTDIVEIFSADKIRRTS